MFPSETERRQDAHHEADAEAQRHPEGNVLQTTDMPKQGVVVEDSPPSELREQED